MANLARLERCAANIFRGIPCSQPGLPAPRNLGEAHRGQRATASGAMGQGWHKVNMYVYNYVLEHGIFFFLYSPRIRVLCQHFP
jgi:hypothetical protein